MKATWQVSECSAGSVFDRWSHGDGYTAGHLDGYRAGFADGYTAGFDAGADVGGARLLLAVEHSLRGRLPELLPQLPHVGFYLAYRRNIQPTNEPCAEGCGACSRCIRAAGVQANLDRYGTDDYPGATAPGCRRSQP